MAETTRIPHGVHLGKSVWGRGEAARALLTVAQMSMHLGAGRSTSLRHVAAEAIISLRTTSTQDAMEARCHSSGCWFFTMMECWTSGREYQEGRKV